MLSFSNLPCGIAGKKIVQGQAELDLMCFPDIFAVLMLIRLHSLYILENITFLSSYCPTMKLYVILKNCFSIFLKILLRKFLKLMNLEINQPFSSWSSNNQTIWRIVSLLCKLIAKKR